MPLLRTVIILAASVTFLVGAELKTGIAPVVTHEWGTFTSVAREDGTAVEWAPLLGPGDLPCFVSRDRQIRKVALRGLVRMETPVLYFYTKQPATLSIHVDFPQGLITEWYPNPLPAAQTYLRAIAAGHSVVGNKYGNAWETSDPASCVE